MDDLIGRLVVSLAGRDKGLVCAVVGVPEPGYVLLADGKTRRVENPKKKKLKHIRPLQGLPDEKARIPETKFTNRFIREAVGAVSDPGTPM